MQAIKQLTRTLYSGGDLDAEAASTAARLLTLPEVDASAKREFLLALADKGETATEVAAFAATFRDYAIDPGVEKWAGEAIDVCGTGGDGSGTFNISTAVSFIVAASGVPVFKHGNRSITSKCGSADLMEALGIRLDPPVEVLRSSLRELNFCFFFAPAFHPAFKEIMPVRKALAAEGRRTIFNLLGPLINPGRPAYQLLGVYSQAWVDPLAEVLASLGLNAGIVAHGRPAPDRALDELSCAGQNFARGFGRLDAVAGTLDPAAGGLPVCGFSELRGGDVSANLATLRALLSGSTEGVPTGLRDSVLLNAGAALWIAGRADGLAAGVDRANAVLTRGEAANWLEKARNFYREI